MGVIQFFWWAMYILIALHIQKLLPGFDALSPGFFIALEEGKKKQTIFLFFLFCLIQEGSGSLRFGSSLLWYSGQAIIYSIGTRFFVSGNIFSVTLLSCLAALHYSLVFWLMSAFQDVPVSYPRLIERGIIQAVFVPIIWYVAKKMRVKGTKNGN